MISLIPAGGREVRFKDGVELSRWVQANRPEWLKDMEEGQPDEPRKKPKSGNNVRNESD